MASKIRAAVVTGAASGLGRALALELAKRGARVVVSDVNADGLAETVEQVRALGGEAHAVHCDVSERASVLALYERAVDQMGEVDCWINNAGVAVVGETGAGDLADWRWCLDINLWGVIHGCDVVTPIFRANKRGWIINIASAAGLLTPGGSAAYNVSKAGVIALTETLQAEAGGDNVYATVVCPLFFETNLMDEARGASERERRMVTKFMERERMTASDVARITIDDALAGRLYSLPMPASRVFWLFKRLLPHAYVRWAPWLADQVTKAQRWLSR